MQTAVQGSKAECGDEHAPVSVRIHDSSRRKPSSKAGKDSVSETRARWLSTYVKVRRVRWYVQRLVRSTRTLHGAEHMPEERDLVVSRQAVR